MAIRDRVTVHTKDGRTLTMQVARQGGSLEQRWPRKGDDPLLTVHMLDKNEHQTGESMVVPVENIASVVTDTAPKENAKKKA